MESPNPPKLDFVIEKCHSGSVRVVCFSPTESKFCTSGVGGKLKIWDLESKKMVSEHHENTTMIKSVDYHPSGKFIGCGGSDKTVRLWRTDPSHVSSPPLMVLKEHCNSVWCVRFSRDGSLLLTSSLSDTIKLWDLEKQASLVTLEKCHVNHESTRTWSSTKNAVFLDTNHVCASGGGSSNFIKIWDFRVYSKEEKNQDRCLVHTFKHEHKSTVCSVAYNHKKQLIAAADEGSRFVVYDYRMLKMYHEYVEHTSVVNQVDFSPSGKYIVSGSWDATAKVIHVEEKKVIFESQKHERHKEGEVVEVVHHKTGIHTVRFSPDGKYFGTGGMDQKVIVWKSNIYESEMEEFWEQDMKERMDFLFVEMEEFCDGNEIVLLRVKDRFEMRLYKTFF